MLHMSGANNRMRVSTEHQSNVADKSIGQDSSLNDSVASPNNKARACKATPKKIHMDMSNSADESEQLETSSEFDASQGTAESTDSPSILDGSEKFAGVTPETIIPDSERRYGPPPPERKKYMESKKVQAKADKIILML